ncbi:MAG: xylose isomerase [Planctomycetes bacterium]|nr:xylose isomerase [Planctomycetota bacterium]
MAQYFPEVTKIAYEGADSKNPLAFKHYDADEMVMGKSMRDHLRFGVAYWHTFKGTGADPFGPGTILRSYNDSDDPMKVADMTLEAAFEFYVKLGIDFWCFHDRDIAPEADTLAETNKRLDTIVAKAKKLQADTGVKLLWGTTNAFSHRRFMAGAGTNPQPEVFAYAASQIKKAIEVTHELGGEGYVFWGGREGYDTLLNTDMSRELDHLALLLQMAVDYKKKIGFGGQFLIEPKPKEPTKHQYDFDAGNCFAFLQKYNLLDYFKLNIEANHATLAGHDFQHELDFCVGNGILGSVDANRGDLMLGWDTDQFPMSIYETTMAMYTILKGGGLTTGGLNFDAKLRRQSVDGIDLFYAHVGAMDCFAKGLKNAAKMIEDKTFENAVKARYAGWDTDFGKQIETGKIGFDELEKYTLENGEPEINSGHQEMFENMLNDYLY